jgi:lysozyme
MQETETMNEVKESIKVHEGYRNKVYRCSENRRTVGYGHLCVEDHWEDGREYDKAYLEEIFEKDFENALYNSRTLIGNRNLNHIAQGVICEMVFQLGIGNVSKFKKMWAALDHEDYEEAGNQMLDSRWAKQTPYRCGKLAGTMKSVKL